MGVYGTRDSVRYPVGLFWYGAVCISWWIHVGGEVGVGCEVGRSSTYSNRGIDVVNDNDKGKGKGDIHVHVNTIVQVHVDGE